MTQCETVTAMPRAIPSREGFIAAYEGLLRQEPGYTWTQDAARMARFMASVRSTLETPANTWNIDSPLVVKAWRAIGCKGKPTYKALKALPAI